MDGWPNSMLVVSWLKPWCFHQSSQLLLVDIDKVTMFSLFKIFIITTNIFHLIAFLILKLLIIQKKWFTNYCNSLVQYSKLFLKNTLKEFVLKGINQFTLSIFWVIAIVKGNVSVQFFLQFLLTVFIFVSKMSIYFVFSTTSHGLS